MSTCIVEFCHPLADNLPDSRSALMFTGIRLQSEIRSNVSRLVPVWFRLRRVR